jgi:hypothetical protein
MVISSLFDFADASWVDPLILWAVAAVAGILVLVTVVNALELFFESESEADHG